ncbi:uncharacterized protein LOC129003310 [Macrosteles quadrilineatus]|uniref:uncharacterized protein LOC129003310 n=1 Tax=Macrosteles quadrilineatus TaxID=74068 RepID=UPI0023E20985|nr:uncharacterized protein LOC129003310 [Macrosteles quadrilineatus]
MEFKAIRDLFDHDDDGNKRRLFSTEFKLFGLFDNSPQGYINKKFVWSTAGFFGLTGWCKAAPELDCVFGFLEGPKSYMDTVKYLLHPDNIQVVFVGKSIFQWPYKEIEKREFIAFSFHDFVVTPETKSFFTPREPKEMFAQAMVTDPEAREYIRKINASCYQEEPLETGNLETSI